MTSQKLIDHLSADFNKVNDTWYFEDIQFRTNEDKVFFYRKDKKVGCDLELILSLPKEKVLILVNKLMEH